MLVRKFSTRSTRFTYFCTVQISKFQPKIVNNFSRMNNEFPILCSLPASNFAFFLRIFDEMLSGFRAKFQKRVACVASSIKFAKTNQKIAENSEIRLLVCENYSLLFILIHSCPYSLGSMWKRARKPRASVSPRRRARSRTTS